MGRCVRLGGEVAVYKLLECRRSSEQDAAIQFEGSVFNVKNGIGEE